MTEDVFERGQFSDEDDFGYGEYENEEGDFGSVSGGSLDYRDLAKQDDEVEGLGAAGDAPRTGAEAIAIARAMSQRGDFVGTGMCLKTVRSYYGVPAKYLDATSSWEHAAHKHRVTRGVEVPRGVPVYWTGGSHGHGHIALSAGAGLCWSTDWLRPGKIDVAKIDDITRRWGLKFEGYALEVNDVIVWRFPKPVGTVSLRNLRYGSKNSDVLKVKAQLWKKGYRGFFPKNPKYGFGTKRAYAKFQRKLGYTGGSADGIPGRLSLKKLGFKVL